MRRSLPVLKKFLSKFSLEILPGVLASVLGGYLLTQWHIGRTPATDTQTEISRLKLEEKQARDQELAFVRDLLETTKSGSNDAASRYYEPVRPVPRLALRDKAGHPENTLASVKPRQDTRPDTTSARAVPPIQATAAAAPAIVMPPLAAPTVVMANNAAKPLIAAQSRAEPSSQIALPPVVVAARPDGNAQPVAPRPGRDAAEQPRKRGFLAAAGSTVSVAIGNTANAVGDAANWTMDLPGRAIGGALSAGSRLIGRDEPQPRADLMGATY